MRSLYRSKCVIGKPLMGKAYPGLSGGSQMLSPVLLFEKQREIAIQTQKRENKVKQRELTATQSIPLVLSIWKRPQGDSVSIYYRGRCSQGTSGLYTPDREWRIHSCVKSPSVLQFISASYAKNSPGAYTQSPLHLKGCNPSEM